MEGTFFIVNNEKFKDTEIPFGIAINNNQVFLKALIPEIDLKFKLQRDNSGFFRLVDQNPFEEDDYSVSEKLNDLTVQFFELQNNNFEPEQENWKGASSKLGYQPEQVIIDKKSFSIYQLYDMVKRERLELKNDFQRNFIWPRSSQSKLIESVLLGLPLPAIFLSRYNTGVLTIVDGLQRITSICNFMDGKLKLSNLEYFKACEGLKYVDMERVLGKLRVLLFEQFQLECYIIDYRSPEQLKYDLFRRLNSNGKPLKNPEIRNCLSRNKVSECLSNLLNSKEMYYATGINVEKDKRMEARDMILRSLYFDSILVITENQARLKGYNGEIEASLDGLVEKLNNLPDQEIENRINNIQNAISLAHIIFGKLAFRKLKPDYQNQNKPPLNKALMAGILVLLRRVKNADTIIGQNPGYLTNSFAKFIKRNQELSNSISSSTNSKVNIETTITELNKFFSENGIIII